MPALEAHFSIALNEIINVGLEHNNLSVSHLTSHSFSTPSGK